MATTPVFLLENPMDRGVGYGPQGLRESDTRLKQPSTLSLAVPFLSVIMIEVCTFFLFYGEVTHVG